MRTWRAILAISHPTPPFRKPRLVPDESWSLCASLSGSLAASVALGSARLDFEATPVVDADYAESESRSRRRRGRDSEYVYERFADRSRTKAGRSTAGTEQALSMATPLDRFRLRPNKKSRGRLANPARCRIRATRKRRVPVRAGRAHEWPWSLEDGARAAFELKPNLAD